MKIKLKTKEFEIARIKSGYTVSEVAQKMGISKQAVYNVLNGKNNFTPARAKKAADVLEKDFDLLFEITDK